MKMGGMRTQGIGGNQHFVQNENPSLMLTATQVATPHSLYTDEQWATNAGNLEHYNQMMSMKQTPF